MTHTQFNWGCNPNSLRKLQTTRPETFPANCPPAKSGSSHAPQKKKKCVEFPSESLLEGALKVGATTFLCSTLGLAPFHANRFLLDHKGDQGNQIVVQKIESISGNHEGLGKKRRAIKSTQLSSLCVSFGGPLQNDFGFPFGFPLPPNKG